MTRNNIEELLKTIQNLRDEKFPEIPEELVNDILLAESEYFEDQSNVLKQLKETVEVYLDKEGNDVI